MPSTNTKYVFYQENNTDKVEIDLFSQYDNMTVSDIVKDYPSIFSLEDTDEPTDAPVLVMTIDSSYGTPTIKFTRTDTTTYPQEGQSFVGARPPHRPT